jgi:hypothetical protein
VFNEVSGTGNIGLVAQFVSELGAGDDIATLAKSPQLTTQLMQPMRTITFDRTMCSPI